MGRELTAEQLERIERNKAEANRRLAQREERLKKLNQEQPKSLGSKVVIIDRDGERQPAFSNQPKAAFAFNGYSAPNVSKATSYSTPGVLLAANQVTVEFTVVSDKFFKVTFSPFHASIVAALKSMPSKTYDPTTKTWSFPLNDYKDLQAKLKGLQNVSVLIKGISSDAVRAFQTTSDVCIGKEPNLEKHIDESLLNALFPFQRCGVIFGIQRRGRLLLADEMGLGKTIQALGIARYFKSDWPLLIVCPSSVKFSWRDQIQRFLPPVIEIFIIEKGSEQLPPMKKLQTVVIMSYDLMVSKRAKLIENSFKAIIFDESHFLKDMKAQRTKAAISIARSALRVILLTGTPALSRPAELYSQICIINSKIFPNFRDFALRYCEGHQGKFCFEAKGCTNSEELSLILTNTVMLIRTKKDVLNDLPPKRQEIVFLSDESITENIKKLKEAKSAYYNSSDKEMQRQCLCEYYNETGLAKAKSVTKFIMDRYFYNGAVKRKILIFAHHRSVMDTISMDVARKGLKAIRIDGGTSSKSREEECRSFQENDDVVVAILSVTAAGVGITLTAASVVVFAELHWNPGTMKQAEDRAHRVGQKDSVFVQYLIAKGTADDIIWPLVQKKLDVLQSCKLSTDTYKNAEKVRETMVSEGSLENYFSKQPAKVDDGKEFTLDDDIEIIHDDDDDKEVILE